MTEQPTNLEETPDVRIEVLRLGLSTRLALAADRVGPIAKDEFNSAQSFKFRSIDTITSKARRAFREFGISVVPVGATADYEHVESQRGTAGYRCVATVGYLVSVDVLDSDGTFRRESMSLEMIGEAVDYGDKSTSKAVQMAYKYLLTEILHVGSGGDDPDSESPEIAAPGRQPVPEHPVVTLKKELAAVYGKQDAAEAWHLMFPTKDEEPSADEVTDARRGEIARTVARLVETVRAKRDGGGGEPVPGSASELASETGSE